MRGYQANNLSHNAFHETSYVRDSSYHINLMSHLPTCGCTFLIICHTQMKLAGKVNHYEVHYSAKYEIHI